jgi:teichuronic acid biosynthesis glycosyltransferase TuaG
MVVLFSNINYMKLVSVIIPYFKKINFIAESVNSAIEQSYNNLEIIIIYDDISHDDLEYILKLKDLDSRISVVINSKTFGAGESRNIGISKSNGQYIAFLDADDIWNSKKIEYQINYMQENNLSCSHTSYDIINEKNITIAHRTAKRFKNFEDLLKSCDIGLSTVMIEKTVFSQYCKFPNMKTKEDFVLWLKILKTKHVFGAIDKSLGCWRNSKNSLSSSTIQKLIDGFKVYYTYMNYNFFKSLYLLICLGLNYLKK